MISMELPKTWTLQNHKTHHPTNCEQLFQHTVTYLHVCLTNVDIWWRHRTSQIKKKQMENRLLTISAIWRWSTEYILIILQFKYACFEVVMHIIQVVGKWSRNDIPNDNNRTGNTTIYSMVPYESMLQHRLFSILATKNQTRWFHYSLRAIELRQSPCQSYSRFGGSYKAVSANVRIFWCILK